MPRKPSSIFDVDSDDPLNLYEEDIEKAQEIARAEAEFQMHFENTFVNNLSGQIMYKWLIAKCGVYDPASSESFGTISQFLGRREVGLELIEKMEEVIGAGKIMEFFRETESKQEGEEPNEKS